MDEQPASFNPPSPKVHAELVNFLEQDPKLYGEIFRKKRAGVSNEEIQKSRGAQFPNFIWNYERYLKALLEGDIPSGITTMNEVAVLFRRVLKSIDISDQTRSYLNLGLQEIEDRKNNPSLREKIESQVVANSTALEKKSTPGIYVYSLMHYINYPYHSESGRTLMKVGKSDRDVIQRFREQTRTTALPEEPVLLRIYTPTDSAQTLSQLEGAFHTLLEAADHDRSTARTGGTEWFLTSLKFLDKIAETLKLEILVNIEDVADIIN
jgi:T5orf172 domain